MNRALSFAIFVWGFTICLNCSSEAYYASDSKTLSEGKALYEIYCMSCHGLESEGFGPPLGGVTSIWSGDSLKAFIQDPEAYLEAGHPRIQWLAERYKRTMPAFAHLAEEDLDRILSYIHQVSQERDLRPVQVAGADTVYTGKSGRLARAIEEGNLAIHLEEVMQLPHPSGYNGDLGLATLRAHPAGNGVIFVSDQRGIIYQIKDGDASVFLDVSEHIDEYQSGPGIATGLGSFVFHPDYLENGLLYLTHAETYKGQVADHAVYADTQKAVLQWVVGEWKMEDIIGSRFRGTYRELMRMHAPTFAHGAQDLGFKPNISPGDPDYGLLYFGFGDGGANNIKQPELSGHNQSFLGTIMRIDPAGRNSKNGKYGIPSDNPFAHSEDPAVVREIYALGFRNPHRMAWDPLNDNNLLATDIGEKNIEEINVIENGGHYGWPYREGTYGINTLIDPLTVFDIPASDKNEFMDPLTAYDHEDGNAISGGFIYQGDIEPLYGKYILGDIVTGGLFFIDRIENLDEPTIYALSVMGDSGPTHMREYTGMRRLHLRISYDPFQKKLYIITKMDGRIYRVVGAEVI